MQKTTLTLATALALQGFLATSVSAQQMEAWVIDGEGERPWFPKAEAAFNEKFKGEGISIKLTPIPTYNETLRSAFTTGGLPDIVMVDGPDMSNYVWSGQLAPLDEYLDAEVLEDLLPAIKDQGTYPPDGKMYMISPYDSTVLLWGNRKYLEAAGVEIPKTLDEAWTMEEFEEVLAKLDKVEGVEWP
nr:extracellular solute-binding protein [Pseudomonadota bacterium]